MEPGNPPDAAPGCDPVIEALKQRLRRFELTTPPQGARERVWERLRNEPPGSIPVPLPALTTREDDTQGEVR